MTIFIIHLFKVIHINHKEGTFSARLQMRRDFLLISNTIVKLGQRISGGHFPDLSHSLIVFCTVMNPNHITLLICTIHQVLHIEFIYSIILFQQRYLSTQNIRKLLMLTQIHIMGNITKNIIQLFVVILNHIIGTQNHDAIHAMIQSTFTCQGNRVQKSISNQNHIEANTCYCNSHSGNFISSGQPNQLCRVGSPYKKDTPHKKLQSSFFQRRSFSISPNCHSHRIHRQNTNVRNCQEKPYSIFQNKSWKRATYIHSNGFIKQPGFHGI